MRQAGLAGWVVGERRPGLIAGGCRSMASCCRAHLMRGMDRLRDGWYPPVVAVVVAASAGAEVVDTLERHLLWRTGHKNCRMSRPPQDFRSLLCMCCRSKRCPPSHLCSACKSMQVPASICTSYNAAAVEFVPPAAGTEGSTVGRLRRGLLLGSQVLRPTLSQTRACAQPDDDMRCAHEVVIGWSMWCVT